MTLPKITLGRAITIGSAIGSMVGAYVLGVEAEKMMKYEVAHQVGKAMAETINDNIATFTEAAK